MQYFPAEWPEMVVVSFDLMWWNDYYKTSTS
jgi:hypothetical protein